MNVIDADGHIIEPEGMFEHLPEDFYLRRPIPVRLPADTVRGDFNGCWLIEGKSVPNIGSRGRTTASLSWTERSKKIDVSLGSQTLEDVESRLSDLDRFHIDCQIVFPTMFLAAVAEDVKLEGALFQAYNTYVGQACAKSKGRVRWVALLPVSRPGGRSEGDAPGKRAGRFAVFSPWAWCGSGIWRIRSSFRSTRKPRHSISPFVFISVGARRK